MIKYKGFFRNLKILGVYLAVSKEVVTYGFILLGSAISQLMSIPWIYGPFSLYMQYAAIGLMLIGVIVIMSGVFWRWGPWKRPLGISLLAVSYVFVGSISIALGGWIFTPLFILALVFFIVAWAIFAGKKWAKTVIEIITIISLLGLVLGIGNDGVVNVPGALSAVYILWYVNRPYVAGYFGSEVRRMELKERDILLVSFLALLLLVPLTFFYIAPPSRRIVDWMAGWGSPASGGISGPEYVFGIGDMLEYSFQVDENSSSIVFSIQREENPKMTIATVQGEYGSGVANVPITGPYWVYAVSVDTYYKVHFEIIVKMFSLRRHILQWAFLDIFLIATLVSIKLRTKRANQT